MVENLARKDLVDRNMAESFMSSDFWILASSGVATLRGKHKSSASSSIK